MNTAKRTEIFRRWREANPEPKSDLEYASHFELLVSVILSAQATDKGVNAATRKLYPVANTPAAILALGEEGLGPYIQTIGLWRAKAKNVIATCRLLIEQHGGAVPHDRAALEALPGVGRKTANVVLNVAFGEHTIAVDTHNFRVANRTGIAPGKTVEAVERALMKFVPKEFLQHAHHWLILHGRYVCKAIKPDCPNCNISDLCEYKHKTPDPLAEPSRESAVKKAVKTPAKRPLKRAVTLAHRHATQDVARQAAAHGAPRGSARSVPQTHTPTVKSAKSANRAAGAPAIAPVAQPPRKTLTLPTAKPAAKPAAKQGKVTKPRLAAKARGTTKTLTAAKKRGQAA